MLGQWSMCLRQGSQSKQKRIIFISNFTIPPLIIPLWAGKVIASKLKKIKQKWLPSLCNRIGPPLSLCLILFSGMICSWVNERMSLGDRPTWFESWIPDEEIALSIFFRLLSSCAEWGSYHAPQRIVVITKLCVLMNAKFLEQIKIQGMVPSVILFL